MGKFRISYFDVVGRALGELDDRRVGKAIERLSATYREGRSDFAHAKPEGRAAYLWHILPAHVCDLARLLLDLPDLLEGRKQITLLGLGAGPGSETLALLEAVSSARARDELEQLAALRVLRADLTREWDHSFQALVPEALAQIGKRWPGLGSRWTFDAEPQAIQVDLGSGDVPASLQAAFQAADLVVAANLVSEVAPRGTDALPPGLRQTFAALLAKPGQSPTDLLLVDRAGAPGARPRLDELCALAKELQPDARVTGPRQRETRCGCGLTRRAKAIYEHVRLPTTKVEDRPVRNCKTVWCRIALPAAQA